MKSASKKARLEILMTCISVATSMMNLLLAKALTSIMESKQLSMGGKNSIGIESTLFILRKMV
jgi:hypothetical protein